MSILDGFKTCRKGLHTYSEHLRQCPECKKLSRQKWSQNNPEKKRVSDKGWQQKNRERVRANQNRWNKNHPDRRSKMNLRWQKENAEKANTLTAKRRASKKQAIPPWVNMKAIAEIYKQASDLTKKTGVLHCVDHIYPLQSKYMCGLHVETNLQILTKSENSIKGNRTWPGQLDCQKD